jgi:hypothetical protein
MVLEFFEENPTLVKQKISNQYTSGDIKSKWVQITETLNATPGERLEKGKHNNIFHLTN